MEDTHKPMEYGPDRKRGMLAIGMYKEVPYWIVSMGTHPCVYLEVTGLKKFDAKELDVHGGITYDECFLYDVFEKEDEDFVEGVRRFIGWDYAHGSDYFGAFDGLRSPEGFHGKKWTTEEMVEEAKRVIDQICVEEMKPDKTPRDGIPVKEQLELIQEYFTEILRASDDLVNDEIFEDMDEELLDKCDINKVRELLNFDAFVDVVKRGVRDKYGVELYF